MNEISKKLLDELMDLQRERVEMVYQHDTDRLYVVSRLCMDKAKQIEEQNREVLGIHVENLTYCIFGCSGFNNDATNEDVYKILEILGWTIVE